jgi:hypothetical protein
MYLCFITWACDSPFTFYSYKTNVFYKNARLYYHNIYLQYYTTMFYNLLRRNYIFYKYIKWSMLDYYIFI